MGTETAAQTLLRLHEKYPDSSAFKAISDTRITSQQRLLELKLERLGSQCRELLDIRLQNYSAPGAKLVLPESIQLPDILQLREERLAELENARPGVPPVCPVRLKLIKEEQGFAADKLSGYLPTAEMLLEFFGERLDVLAQKRYSLLLRWARNAQSGVGVERLSPGLVSMLDACLEEFEICQKNLNRITQYKDSIPRNLSPADTALKAPPVPITPKGAKVFSRWMCSSARLQRRMNKFFAKMLWSPSLKKYDTIRKAKDIVAQSLVSFAAGGGGGGGGGGAGGGAGGGGGGGGGSSSSAPVTAGAIMPTMVTAPEKLAQLLEHLREQFGISAELDEDDGQRFQFEANRLAHSVHAAQASDKVFPLYGTSFIEKLKGEGAAAGVIAASFGAGHTDSSAAAQAAAAMDFNSNDHRITFLKEARWLESILIEPDLDSDMVQQTAVLGANKKIDHILKVEISFVDEDDLSIVGKRLQEQVATHGDRSVAHGDLDSSVPSSLAAGFAGAHGSGVDASGSGGGGIGNLKSSSSNLPSHKLLPYYWLRLLRVRQSKRKVLSCLNFFRSVERRICIDMHGFAFNSVHTTPANGSQQQQQGGVGVGGGGGDDKGGFSSVGGASGGVSGRMPAANSMLAEKGSGVNATGYRAPTLNSIREGGPTVDHDIFALPSDYAMNIDTIMSLESVENRDDFYSVDENGLLRIRDSHGLCVIYDAAIKDARELDAELLRIGSYYILQHKERHVPDRVAMLEDLYDCESSFHDAKRRVIMSYLVALDNALEPEARHRIMKRIANIIARRPHLDLSGLYPTESYAAEIVSMELEASLLRDVFKSQIQEERAYRNFIHARLHETSSTIGFPDPVYENGLHGQTNLAGVASVSASGLKSGGDRGSLLLNGLDPIICPVTDEELGPLDIYSSLGKAALVANMLDHIVEEHVHSLTSVHPVLQSAIRICVLQQALVEWRLLVEEDALISEAQKQSVDSAGQTVSNTVVNPKIAAIGVPPWSHDTLLIDDPFAVDLIVQDVYKEQTKGKPTETPKDTKELVALSQAELNAYMGLWALIATRAEIIDALDETEALKSMYSAQAKLFNEDCPLTFPPITFEGETRQMALKPDPLGIDLAPRLAISEIDSTMGVFDFNSVTGVRMLLSKPVDEMRTALKLQGIERSLLAVALVWNHILIHYAEKEGEYQEDVTLGLRSGEGSSTFMTAVPIARLAGTTDVSERRQKARLEGRKSFKEALMRHSSRWMSVAAVKKPRRDALLAAFNSKHSSITKGPKALQGMAAVRRLRELKYELMTTYFNQITLDITVPSMQADVAQAIGRLLQAVAPLPKRQQLFSTTEDVADSSVFMMVQDSEDSGDMHKTFNEQGQVSNIFFIPTLLEVLDHLPTDHISLQHYHRALHSIIDIFYLSQAHSVLAVPPADSLKPTAGLEATQMELLKLRTMLSGLPVPKRRDIAVVAEFLSQHRRRLFLRLKLGLLESVQRFVRTGVSATAIALLRRVLTKMTLPSRLPQLLLVGFAPIAQQKDLAKVGPLLLSDPPLQFSALVGALIGLESNYRAVVMAETNKMELLAEETLNQHGLSETSSPEEAQAAVLKLYDTCAILESLKAVLCKKVLQIPYLRDAGDCRRWDSIWETRILSQLGKAREEAETELAAIEAAEASRGEDEDARRTAPPPQSDKVRILTTEIGAKEFTVKCVEEEVHQLVLSEAIQSVVQMYSHLVEEVEYLGKGGTHMGGDVDLFRPGQGGVPRKPAAMRQQGLESIKVDIVAEFLSDLRSSWTPKRQKDGLQALFIPEDSFNQCVDSLARKLRDWGNAQIEERLATLRFQNARLRHMLVTQERNAAYLTALRELDRRSMERRIDAAVTDQCYTLLFRIDSLNKQLADTTKALHTMETTVREQVRKEFEELVRELGMQLTRVKSQFKEYRDSLQTDMKGSIHEIRKDALIRMAQSQTAPEELKKVTAKMAGAEDQIAELTSDNAALKRALLKLRALNQMKDISQKATFDKQISKIEAEKQHANKELFQSRDEVEQKMSMLKTQLEATQSALLQAELERDKLRKELELANRNKQALLQWKVAKSMLLEELETKVKKFERWSHIDVDKLLIELERKDMELKQMKTTNSDTVSKHRLLIESKATKLTKRLKMQILHEQRMKNEAFQKLEAVRSDFRWEEYYEGSGDTEALQVFWKRRYHEANAKLQGALEESDRLWQLICESGVEIPPTLEAWMTSAGEDISTADGGRASVIESLMSSEALAVGSPAGPGGAIRARSRQNRSAAAAMRPHSTLAIKRPATTMALAKP